MFRVRIIRLIWYIAASSIEIRYGEIENWNKNYERKTNYFFYFIGDTLFI